MGGTIWTSITLTTGLSRSTVKVTLELWEEKLCQIFVSQDLDDLEGRPDPLNQIRLGLSLPCLDGRFLDDRGCGGVLITTCNGLFSILFHGSYSCDKENKVKKKNKKKNKEERREKEK